MPHFGEEFHLWRIEREILRKGHCGAKEASLVERIRRTALRISEPVRSTQRGSWLPENGEFPFVDVVVVHESSAEAVDGMLAQFCVESSCLALGSQTAARELTVQLSRELQCTRRRHRRKQSKVGENWSNGKNAIRDRLQFHLLASFEPD